MFCLEIVAGILANSTALLADSLDMLADAAIYEIALYAVGKPDSAKRAAALTSWYEPGATGLVLGEPRFAKEKEEGETALRLGGEKVLSPETICG
jgi:hypothetical protein